MKAKVINEKSSHCGSVYSILQQERGYFSVQLDCGGRGKLWFNIEEVEFVNRDANELKLGMINFQSDIIKILDEYDVNPRVAHEIAAEIVAQFFFSSNMIKDEYKKIYEEIGK